MNSTRDDLLRTVLENPFDDAPRLVMADWLEENGEPERAEFIRVQYELARTPEWINLKYEEIDVTSFVRYGEGASVKHLITGGDQNPRWVALRHRERELLDGTLGLGVGALPIVEGMTRTNYAGRGGYGWFARETPNVPGIVAEFRRGFIESITLTCDDFMRHTGAIFAAAPVVEVRLSDKHAVPNPVDMHSDEVDGFYFQLVRPMLGFPDVREEPFRLPAEVFDSLTGGQLELMPLQVNNRIYRSDQPSRSSAEALSDACVSYGRKQAGLPPIKSRK